MKIDHINIIVTNIDASTKFYVEVLGFEKTLQLDLEDQWMEELTGFKKPKAKCVFLETPNKSCRIELLEYINPKVEFSNKNTVYSLNKEGIRHMALEVDNIYELHKKARDYGIESFSEPIKAPLELVPQGKTLCYLKAPDDVILELAQYGLDNYNEI